MGFSEIFSYNFHPPLASFPFALLFIIFFSEAINLRRKSEFLRNLTGINLTLASLFVIITFFSGYQAAEKLNIQNENLQSVISYHHNAGRILMFLTVYIG